MLRDDNYDLNINTNDSKAEAIIYLPLPTVVQAVIGRIFSNEIHRLIFEFGGIDLPTVSNPLPD